MNEELHPDLQKAINKAAPRNVHNVIRKVAANLRAKGQDPGLKKTLFPTRGSSRAVIHMRKPKEVSLDGKPTKVHTTMKYAYRGVSDDKKEGRLLGQAQNQVESSDKLKPYHMMHQDGQGNYHTNENGLIPTVHHVGDGHKHIVVDRVEPLSTSRFQEATKSSTHPKGLTPQQFTDTLRGYDNIGAKHPLIKKFNQFRRDTGVSDFHPGNFGIWKHPHTGKDHVVLLDAGLDDEVLNHHRLGIGGMTSGGMRTRNQKFVKRVKVRTRMIVKRRSTGKKVKWNMRHKLRQK